MWIPGVRTRASHSCALSLWNDLSLSVLSAILVATFNKHLFDLGLFPLDTGTPGSPLMPWNHFIDFAVLSTIVKL